MSLGLGLEFWWAVALPVRVSLEGGASWSCFSSGHWIGPEEDGLGMGWMVGNGRVHTPGTLDVGTGHTAGTC